jgi:hypothetical protein
LAVVTLNEAEARALLELFSVVDDIYTEHDCFEPAKVSIGYGRAYRAWKRCRDVLAAQSYAPLQSRPPERSERARQHLNQKTPTTDNTTTTPDHATPEST